MARKKPVAPKKRDDRLIFYAPRYMREWIVKRAGEENRTMTAVILRAVAAEMNRQGATEA
jgi:hypothetical protein